MKKNLGVSMSAAAFVAAMSLSLIACDDSLSANSNSTNNEAPVAPTDSVESGVSVDSLLIQSCTSLAPNVPCADNTDGKYYKNDLCYFKCENNAWKGVTKVPSDVTFYSYSELESMTQNQLPKCAAETEGMVKRIWEGNPKYGSAWTYRCENGEWMPRDLRVTCDTAGVQVGDICRKDDVPWNIFEETPGKKDTVSYECLNGEWSNFKITD